MKNDKRVQYTKNIIKSSFFELLNKKNIEKITVKELCEKAEINRATFYKHYEDIFDLQNKINENYFNELKNIISNYDTQSKSTSFLKNLLEIIKSNKEVSKIIFNSDNSWVSLNEVISLTYKNVKNKWIKCNPKLDSKTCDYLFLYLSNASIGIIKDWVKNDMLEDIEYINNFIHNINKIITNNYFKKSMSN